jgi:AcrR family transcriptional regulator
MQAPVSNRADTFGTRRQIIATAIRFYARIGHKKTTVAGIAHELSMSPANVYRFFRSKRAIEEAVVAERLEEIVVAAAGAAHEGGSAIERLQAVLQAVSRLHADRRAHQSRLHELVATAMHQNWPIATAYSDRMTRIVREVIAAGQARGELRAGDAVTLTRCLLVAMDVHCSTRMARTRMNLPTLKQMLDFCMSALRLAPPFSEAPTSQLDSHSGALVKRTGVLQRTSMSIHI